MFCRWIMAAYTCWACALDRCGQASNDPKCWCCVKGHQRY